MPEKTNNADTIRAALAEARGEQLRLEVLKALQGASALRNQLRQREFNYEMLRKSQARVEALETALRELRLAAVLVPVDWANPEAAMLSAKVVEADERAAAALKGEA